MPMPTPPLAWNFSALFATDPAAHTAERERIETAVAAFVATWKERSDYLEQPAALREALDAYEALQRPSSLSGQQLYYWQLRNSQDQNDPAVKAALNKSVEFAQRMISEIQFFEIRLAKVPAERQAAFLAAAELEPYRHFLEGIFAIASHTLSEPEEKVMLMKGQAAHGNWVQMTSALLSKEERDTLLEDGSRGPVALEQLLTLLSSQDKAVRDEAAAHVNDLVAQFRELGEHELNAILGNKKVDDELRAYDRPDRGRHLSDDIETEAVDTLVETVAARFDIAARFYALKAKLLGLPKLAYHERNVEYGAITKKYSYPEGVALAGKAIGSLDPEFGQIFDRLVSGGNVDVLPAPGKRGGAFCAYHGLGDPVVMLLNYTERLQDVLTLAHESGHAINFEMVRGAQHALYYGTSTATAEVASTFMEDFVMEAVLADADDELRLAVQMMKLNDDVSTIFRQVACYRFEQDLHASFREAGYLSADAIGELFQKHMAAYMGEAVEQSPGSENWWTYWSHIRQFFYVYSYASGLLISKALQGMVHADPKAIAQVKEFFRAGQSASTSAIFKKLGIDISDAAFWNTGLDLVEALLEETEALAKKLGKA